MVPVGEVPKPIKPPAQPKDLVELHPSELARQMTLIEFDIYRRIQPTECLDLRWSKKQESAPNVLELIRRFNLISAVVAYRILQEKETSPRVKVLNFFINVALECQRIQNFNGMMEIVSALNSSAIHRLKRTFDSLSQKMKSAVEQFATFSSSNFKAYRDTVRCAEPPCLPYLGVYLSDLTFLEEANANVFAVDSNQGDSIINIDKRKRVAATIVDLINFQKKPFAFESLPKVRDLIEGTLSNIEREFGIGRTCRAEEHLYQLSLECEPRNASGSSTAGTGAVNSLLAAPSSISNTIQGFFTKH